MDYWFGNEEADMPALVPFPRPPKDPARGATYLGVGLGTLGSTLLAFILVPRREQVPNANMVLLITEPGMGYRFVIEE